jgi:lipoyl(octanoyl) transferase
MVQAATTSAAAVVSGTLRVERLGRMAYEDALAVQTLRRDAVLAGGDDHILLVEHWPVITVGRGGDERHVLRRDVPVMRVNRGGDVTYHGPGQVVGYPIIDLARRGCDVHRYLRELETVMIDTAARFGVVAARRPGFTGVWIGADKLAAIGVGIRRWVTMHGFALNVVDLRSAFAAIVPCGLAGTGVTSLAEASGRTTDLAVVEETIAAVFATRFGYDAVVECVS